MMNLRLQKDSDTVLSAFSHHPSLIHELSDPRVSPSHTGGNRTNFMDLPQSNGATNSSLTGIQNTLRKCEHPEATSHDYPPYWWM